MEEELSSALSDIANHLAIYSHDLGDMTPSSEHWEATGQTPQGDYTGKNNFNFLKKKISMFFKD